MTGPRRGGGGFSRVELLVAVLLFLLALTGYYYVTRIW